jgi:hypothetical protein
MDYWIFLPLLPLSVTLLMIGFRSWENRRSKDLIDRWAHSNKLRLVQMEHRIYFARPLGWRNVTGQAVYRITVVDQYGQRQSGWVRCGGRWWGLHSDKITVRWD